MTMDYNFLSKDDSLYLKGLAILLIVLHNFFIKIPPVTLANEFFFHISFLQEAWNNFSVTESLNIVLSFIGYGGIYIFFFLSGYGLSKKMRLNDDPFYAIKRIWQLEKLLLIGLVVYLIFNPLSFNFLHIINALSLTNNFFFKNLHQIEGSWWFLFCLAQLYVIFYPLYRFIGKNKNNFLLIIYLYIMLAYIGSPLSILLEDDEFFYRIFIGHIPEFCLGIFVATYENSLPLLQNKKTYFYALTVGIIIFILCQLTFWLWIFSGLAFVAIFISSYKLLKGYVANKYIKYLGKISPYVYIIHCVLLLHFFTDMVKNSSAYEKIMSCALWFCVVLLAGGLLSKLFALPILKRCGDK